MAPGRPMIRCETYEAGRRCVLEEGHPGYCVPSANMAAGFKPVEEVYAELYELEEDDLDAEWREFKP